MKHDIESIQQILTWLNNSCPFQVTVSSIASGHVHIKIEVPEKPNKIKLEDSAVVLVPVSD